VKKIFLDKVKLGAQKIIENDLVNCKLYVVKFNDEESYLVFIFQGAKSNYFKLTLPFTGKWTCENALYYPYGLFGFFLNDEDLNFKLKEKIDILRQFESRQV